MFKVGDEVKIKEHPRKHGIWGARDYYDGKNGMIAEVGPFMARVIFNDGEEWGYYYYDEMGVPNNG